MILPLKQWLACEGEKFKAEFLSSEHPGPFAWTYFLRAAINARAAIAETEQR